MRAERNRDPSPRLLSELIFVPYRRKIPTVKDFFAKWYKKLKCGTAATEAVMEPEIRRAARAALEEIDDTFAARLRFAREHGELPAAADPAILGKLASALLHTLSIRARTGAPRAQLEAIARAGVG